MSEHQDVLNKTKRMKEYLIETDHIYEKTRKENKEADFYSEVKPFVDTVQQFADEWSYIVNEWIQKYRPRNVVIQQIDNAKENFKEICVQAFFPKTSYSRFKHNVNSIQYTLEKLMTEINKQIH